MRNTSLDGELDLEVHEGRRGPQVYQCSNLAQPYQGANYMCGAFSATAASILSKRLLPLNCLSSQSEVAKPLAGWHAKLLTNIRSAFTSEPKTLDYGPKLRNI